MEVLPFTPPNIFYLLNPAKIKYAMLSFQTIASMFDLLFGWRKASKCKKLIRRVQCRLKLLKNKRSCVVKQLREDIAQLLRNGHHQAAFQRVEQVVLDENMVQIYDLLYQFCEFVVIKLPYIRKHRDCPNDINEAVSTLIFSSPRFGELPELLPIRKLLGERYGRKFTSAALELLPGNLVKHQIVENLDMKIVPDDVKHRFLDEIARSCIHNYKPKLDCLKAQITDQHNCKILLNEDKKLKKESCFGFSSENSAELGEEVIYLDDIVEFMPPVVKNGSLQDQRLFLFKPFGTGDGIDIDRVATQQNERKDEKWEVSTIKKCSSARPCHFCTREVNEAVDAEEFSRKRTSPLQYTLRATNMPCERPKDSNDNINRSSSCAFSQSYGGYLPRRHVHPKLPDYDELAAKFMELKRATLRKNEASKAG